MTPPAGQGRWYPSNNYLAQVTHVLGGAVVILLAHLQGSNPFWVWLVLALVVAVKEFIGDTYILEHDTFQGDAIDWFFYQCGAGLATLTTFYFWPGVIAGSLWVLTMACYDVITEGESYD